MSHFNTKFLPGFLILFLSFSRVSFAQVRDCNCQNDPLHEIKLAALNIESTTRQPQFHEVHRLGNIAGDKEAQGIWPGVDVKKLGAIQTIFCGDKKATAVLACDNQTILTNAHAIMEDNRALLDCEFYIDNGNGGYSDAIPVETSQLDEMYASSRIGVPYLNRDSKDDGGDWAVLKLREPVSADVATPLRVAKTDSTSHLTNRSYLMVSSYMEGFKNPDEQNPPRAYTVCEGVDYAKNWNGHALHTNCPSAPGASGSPMIQVHNGEPLIFAIHSRSAGYGERLPAAAAVHSNMLYSLMKYGGKDCAVPVEFEEEKTAELSN